MSTFDSQVFAQRAASLAAAVRPALREAQAKIALESIRTSREFLDRDVYSKPEDRRPNGKKKWVRTGRLRREENVAIRPDDSVHLINRVPYAEPRHEANKPGRRQINPERTAHWRDQTLQVMRPRQLEIYRQEILAMLRGRRS